MSIIISVPAAAVTSVLISLLISLLMLLVPTMLVTLLVTMPPRAPEAGGKKDTRSERSQSNDSRHGVDPHESQVPWRSK